MRLKLLRRRLSISAPRMIVRSHQPWSLRWAVVALMVGFSAALALWAFEFGKNIAGVDRHSADELERLRVEVAQLRGERESSLSGSNTVQSLLTAEKTVQEEIAAQLKQAEAENLQLKADLRAPVAGRSTASPRSLSGPAGHRLYSSSNTRVSKASPTAP